MRNRAGILMGLVCAVWAGASCKNSSYCDSSHPCGSGATCEANTCKANGGASGSKAGAGGAGGVGGMAGIGGVGGAVGGARGQAGAGGAGGQAGAAGAGGFAPPRCNIVGCGGSGGASVCDTDAGTCVECLSDTDCKTSDKPICFAHACAPCKSNTDCRPDGGQNLVCNADAGTCVMCTHDSDCTASTALTKTPICGADNTCHACATDSDCTSGPQVCMMDGHCAASAEVLFVQASSTSCSATGNGSSTTPYCAPNDAVAHLGSGVSPPSVIIIVGAQSSNMTIGLPASGTAPTAVLVIGRPDGTSVGSIPANNSAAISVSLPSVTIRDLKVAGGIAPTSKGIVLAGTNATLTLDNVIVDLGNSGGLGIDAEPGTTLYMKNGCDVLDNPKGGILLNNAAFDIEDTTVNQNGTGQFGSTIWGGIFANFPTATPPSPMTLSRVTIEKNISPGLVCSGKVDASGVLASGNGSIDIVQTCMVTAPCTDAGASCGAQ
jgi:hypothetical protein